MSAWPVPSAWPPDEAGLLGALLLDPGRLAEVTDIVGPGDFASAQLAELYRAVVAEVAASPDTDSLSILRRVPGAADAARQLTSSAVPASARRRAMEVREAAVRRRTSQLLTEYSTQLLHPTADMAEVLSTLQAEVRDLLHGARGSWPAPLDLHVMAQREPHPPRFLIENYLPVGYATLLAGHGGAGKSAIALQLGVCIALGVPWWGIPVQRRRVLYVSCEDRSDVLHWRLSRICAHMGVQLADLAGHLDLIDLVGHDAVLWAPHVLRTGTPMPAMRALAARAAASRAEVIVIDGISDTFGGNEILRAEVRAYIASLLALVDPQRGAVLLIGHVNKATATTFGAATGDGYSGSTAWHNSVRARWYLRPETRQDDEATERTGDLILDLQKSNMGRTDHSMRISWSDAAHTFVGRPITSETALDRRARDRRERDAIMAALRAVVAAGEYVPAATTGSRTAYHVMSAHADFAALRMPSTRVGRRRFQDHIEALRAMGHIRESSIARGDRHRVATLEPVEPSSTEVCGHAGHES